MPAVPWMEDGHRSLRLGSVDGGCWARLGARLLQVGDACHDHDQAWSAYDFTPLRHSLTRRHPPVGCHFAVVRASVGHSLCRDTALPRCRPG